ncbi:MAG: BON domain-containing protein [Pseudomonadota bacterium]
MKKILKYTVAMSIILGLAGCDKQPASTETVGEKIDRTTETVNKDVNDASKKTEAVLDDTAITAKVKAAILAEPNLKSLQINVETANHDVTLSGSVDSQEQFTRAQELTSSLAGVKGVSNNLVVKSTNTATNNAGETVSDTSITTKVKAALLAEPNLKSRNIKVETNNGTVTLSGDLETQEQVDKAQEITKPVAGVKDVKNNITVANKKSGEVLGDTSITAKVKAAILAEPHLKSLQINVETDHGTVTLSGSVDSKDQLKRVKEITSATAGVKHVKDNLVVKS